MYTRILPERSTAKIMSGESGGGGWVTFVLLARRLACVRAMCWYALRAVLRQRKSTAWPGTMPLTVRSCMRMSRCCASIPRPERCNALESVCVAVGGSVLKRVAVCCSVLQRVHQC